MPTYDYVCAKCGHQFEAFQSMSDAPLTKCPKCKTGRVRRLVGAGAGFMFKGSGFYETDYKHRSAAPASGAPSSTASKACDGSCGCAKAGAGAN